jgi:hypothetical protein
MQDEPAPHLREESEAKGTLQPIQRARTAAEVSACNAWPANREMPPAPLLLTRTTKSLLRRFALRAPDDCHAKRAFGWHITMSADVIVLRRV